MHYRRPRYLGHIRKIELLTLPVPSLCIQAIQGLLPLTLSAHYSEPQPRPRIWPYRGINRSCSVSTILWHSWFLNLNLSLISPMTSTSLTSWSLQTENSGKTFENLFRINQITLEQNRPQLPIVLAKTHDSYAQLILATNTCELTILEKHTTGVPVIQSNLLNTQRQSKQTFILSFYSKIQNTIFPVFYIKYRISCILHPTCAFEHYIQCTTLTKTKA